MGRNADQPLSLFGHISALKAMSDAMKEQWIIDMGANSGIANIRNNQDKRRRSRYQVRGW
jgi:hypothetical protein